ncbi:MAG: CRISPR system precrRNA processing endoribonuclease RAMP protein Cas6 [Caldilineaceae bacterium]|nr:CRISPR system precrRNA processing endoribonuclease RAMP protein Cas6 [Caldilineaceae bacterium]
MTTFFPEHLHIGVYRVTLVALEPVELSFFSAATLRGAFGWSFKRMVCYQPQVPSCEGCLLRGQCPYPRVFEPPPPPGTLYAQQERAVAPYVLRRPLAEADSAQRHFREGEAIVFEIVLVGWANGLLPYFALALQQLEVRGVGRGRGRVAVAAIDLLPPPFPLETAQPALPLRLFNAQTPGQIENHGGWPASQWISAQPAPAQVTVHFATPTRLQSDGHVQGEPAFQVLYRALLRRVSALCTVHTDQMWTTDFAQLAEAAHAVQTTAASMTRERRHRHSDRQGEMEFWGAEGLMVYSGDLTLFWPLLQLGQAIHVGKNCTFGLGQYRLLA